MTAIVELDRNGLEVLNREACLRMLSCATLGRIGVTSGALPTILPVNYRLVGDTIVIRTAAGTKLDAATRNTVVAFEVDDMDPFEHTGWSVVVTGVAREVTDIGERALLDHPNVPRWAPEGEDRLVAISIDIVSGRRIV